MSLESQEAVTTLLTSWPAWMSGVAVFAIIFLRRELRAFLDRAGGLSLGNLRLLAKGQDTAPGNPPQATLPVPPAEHAQDPPTTRERADIVLAAANDPHVVTTESAVDVIIEQAGVVGDALQTNRVLRRLLANFMVQAEFEWIYGFIYGSQVSLLRRANAVRATTEAAQQIYESARPEKPLIPFDTWLRNLMTLGLLEQQGQTIDSTIKGQAFLKFLVIRRKPEKIF